MSDDILNGMSEISRYLSRSETTVLQMHRSEGLPMRKNAGTGTWISSKRLIDEWNQKLLKGESPFTDEELIELEIGKDDDAIEGYRAAGYETKETVESGGKKLIRMIKSSLNFGG